MSQRSSGRARDRIGEAGGTALGNYNPMRACGQRRSNDRAQIVRILDAIKQDDESDLAAPGIRACENIFQSSSGPRRGQRDDTLMIFGIGQAV